MESLLLGLLAGLATAAGGLLLVLNPAWRPEARLRRLGLAGGMMAAAVLLALALPALEIAGPASLLAGGLAGWVLVARMAHALGGGALAAVAMGVHNLPEGLALGVAPAAIGEEAAWLLLASIALRNIPEGLAVAAGALVGAAAAAWSTAALPWALGIAAGAMTRTLLEIWPRPTCRDVAPAGIGGAAGYAGVWALLAA